MLTNAYAHREIYDVIYDEPIGHCLIYDYTTASTLGADYDSTTLAYIVLLSASSSSGLLSYLYTAWRMK